MPEEIGYSRQVGPQAAEPMPLASPASFGAQLGAQVQSVASQIAQQKIEAYKQDRRHSAAEEWAGFQRGFAMARENIGGISRERRKNAGAGHAEAMGENWEAHRAALLDGIGDPGVQRRAAEAFGAFGLQVRTGEAEFEEIKRVENILLDETERQQIGANRVRRLDDHGDFLTELAIGHDAIDGYGLADEQARKARDDWDRQASIAFVRGTIDRDPGLAHGMLDQGLFDDMLQPKDIEVLRNGAEVEVRALENAAQREIAEARAATIEQARTTIARQGRGIATNDEDWAAIEGEVALTGDTSLLDDVQQARAEAGFVRIYEQVPPAQMEQRVAVLAGKDDLSDREARELDWLRSNADSRQADFDRDPAGFLIEAGGAPVLDLNDPSSLQRRARWAAMQIEANGRHVPPISKPEAAPLRDMLAQGQSEQVLAILDGFADPFSRIDAAQVIAPDDALFHRLAVTSPAIRAQVRMGAQALEANSALLKADEFEEGAQHMAGWQLRLQQALRMISPEDTDAVWQTARMLMASSLATNPGASIGEMPDRFFRLNVQMALGATFRTDSAGRKVQYGGIATASNGSTFMLADGLSAKQWSDQTRVDLVRQREAGSGPVNPDGSAASLDEARPVWMGGSFYSWQDRRGRPIRDAEGRAFVTNVAQR